MMSDDVRIEIVREIFNKYKVIRNKNQCAFLVFTKQNKFIAFLPPYLFLFDLLLKAPYKYFHTLAYGAGIPLPVGNLPSKIAQSLLDDYLSGKLDFSDSLPVVISRRRFRCCHSCEKKKHHSHHGGFVFHPASHVIHSSQFFSEHTTVPKTDQTVKWS